MAKLTTIQQFRSVEDLKIQCRAILPRPYDWRLLSPAVVGTINGIPTMQGTAVATNGILVAILQPTGIIFGHMDFFVADKQSEAERPVVAAKPAPSPRQRIAPVDVSEFI